jgi:hypothetical protein
MNYALTAQQQTNHHSSRDNIMKINKYITTQIPTELTSSNYFKIFMALLNFSIKASGCSTSPQYELYKDG